MRLFVAIDLPGELKSALMGLRSGIAGARWVPGEQLHLTLAFVGEVEAAACDLLSERLAQIRGASFQLHCSGLGCFPHDREPRIIWAGLKPEPLLDRLVKLVRLALLDAGMKVEERPLTPHITLARFRQPVPKESIVAIRQLQLPELPPVSVQEFILYSSNLTPQGAVHTPLRHFPLPPEDKKKLVSNSRNVRSSKVPHLGHK